MCVVSIIVPCFNSADFLAATVASVLAQDLQDWELILVDDGSADSTWALISQFRDSRITGFQKSNAGTTRARNYGSSKASAGSRYLLFLDHDDQLEPNALSRMCGYLDEHPEVGLVGCQFQDLSADGSKLGSGRRSRWAPGRLFPHELRDDEVQTPFATFFCATGQGPFAVYRKSVYEQTEGWDPNLWPHEDTDMFCQMALLGEVHFLPERLYLKRIHPAQGMNDGARVQRAYAAFRAKWDNRAPRNAREAQILGDARSYYYSMHRPCRELKVARKAWREFMAAPSFDKLRWCLRLVGSALRGFVLRR